MTDTPSTKEEIARLEDDLIALAHADFRETNPETGEFFDSGGRLIMRAVSALRGVEDPWKPIGTAPTDGTRVDLWCVPPWIGLPDRVVDCWLSDGRWWRYDGNGDDQCIVEVHHATHWMPRPAPPSKQEGAGSSPDEDDGETYRRVLTILDEADRWPVRENEDVAKRIAIAVAALDYAKLHGSSVGNERTLLRVIKDCDELYEEQEELREQARTAHQRGFEACREMVVDAIKIARFASPPRMDAQEAFQLAQSEYLKAVRVLTSNTDSPRSSMVEPSPHERLVAGSSPAEGTNAKEAGGGSTPSPQDTPREEPEPVGAEPALTAAFKSLGVGKYKPIQPAEPVGAPAFKVYVTSRARIPERSAMWRELRDQRGYQITSSWIDEAGEGETEDYTDLWTRIAKEIAEADKLVLYAEQNDFPLKGAILEAGLALGMGKPVIVCLPGVTLEGRTMRPIGSWLAHPLVARIDSLTEAMSCAPSPTKDEDVGDGVAVSPQDPLALLAGIKEFGLAPDGADLRDLQFAIATLLQERDEAMRFTSVATRTNAQLRATMQTQAEEICHEIETQTEVFKALQAERDKLRAALGFYRSVIQSGEGWTDTCQKRWDDALAETGA